MTEVMVMPSLEEPKIRSDRDDFTAEQESIQAILDDTIAQAESTGEVVSGLADYDPPNPNPVLQYTPRFDIGVPVDERVTLMEQPDGSLEPPLEPTPPDPLNPDDPMSPLATSDSVGAGPAYPDGVLTVPPSPQPWPIAATTAPA